MRLLVENINFFKGLVMSKLLRSLMVGAGLMTVANAAFAGTTGTEFQALFNLVSGWATGYLGKALAITAFLIGAVVGVAKSTAMPALVGLAFAMVFSIGPGVITGMMTAVI